MYFWLNTYSFKHTFVQDNVKYHFTFKYEIWQGNSKLTDSNGILNGIRADSNGRFNVEVRIYITDEYMDGNAQDCPGYTSGTLTESVTIYAGFSQYNPVGVSGLEYTIQPCVHCYVNDFGL